MPQRNAIVGTIRLTQESGARPAPGRMHTEVTFRGGQKARIDPADPRSTGWLAALQTLQVAGLPAYVEVDDASGLVAEVLVPMVVRVGEMRDSDGGVDVELIVSQARHTLSRQHARFDDLHARLDQARRSGSAVLVTEQDDQVIIDVRALPEDVQQPPPPIQELEPRPEALEAGPTVSMSVANRMFALVNGKTCCSTAPSAPCIPFTYPDDGCWGRAHEMCRLMATHGVSPRKVWIYGGLKVDSANKPSCRVYWGWHVAPTLSVATGSGPSSYVIDPSLFPSPVTRSTWKGVQGDPTAQLVQTSSQVFHRSSSGAVIYDPSYTQTNQVLATYRAKLQLRSSSSTGPPPYPQCQRRPAGTQWFGTLGPNQTRRWFTYNWPAQWHVVWTAMPTSICMGAPQLRWSTAVERASSTRVTYWITVTNLTPRTVRFEGRYDVLSR